MVIKPEVVFDEVDLSDIRVAERLVLVFGGSITLENAILKDCVNGFCVSVLIGVESRVNDTGL